MQRIGIAILVALSGFAGAEESSGDQTAARAHFQAGQVYFQRGELERALGEFIAAKRDADRPELDFNLGRTYDRLGDAARAIDGYRRYLDRRPDASDREELEARIAQIAPLVGRLLIVTHTPDAEVRVDGERATVGLPFRIAAGHHEVTAAREGWRTARVNTTIAGEQVTRIEIDPIAPLQLTPLPVATTQAAPAPERRRSRGWIAVVAVGTAVVVAAAVVLAILLRPQPEAGTAGTFPPGLQVLP